jgi:CubicO group peptidase (beta-lactamase class C family)
MTRTRLRNILLTLLTLVALGTLFVLYNARTPLPVREGQRSASEENLARYHRGQVTFPGEAWAHGDPEALGWSAEQLEATRQWAEGLDSGAVFVVHRGLVVADWGATEERLLAQSIRKSLLSGLFGRLVEEGRLDLDATLTDLDIDDEPPLTVEERQATVRDLLLSRSGIYRSAIYEAGVWRRRKPDPGTHAPGEAWFYNNWGFNALGTIFENASGVKIGEAFERWIAEPIAMEDFRVRDVTYLTQEAVSERVLENVSRHPAYMFHISSRDLARFGWLYANGGVWAGQRVLSREWVEESTVGAAQATGWEARSHYGFLWWRLPPSGSLTEPSFMATGGQGHRLVVVPELELVIVHRVKVKGTGLGSQLYRRFVWRPSVDDAAVAELVQRIVAAHPEGQGKVVSAAGGPSGTPRGASPSPS